MLIALAQILAGFVLLAWAADRLVTGSAAFARNLGMPPLLIGLTIIGFGTSAPELVVSATAAWRGSPSLAFGNAIGSNIANVALILGLTALIYPLRVESATLKREFPVLAAAMLLTLALIWDLNLGRFEGGVLAIALLMVLAAMIYYGLRGNGRDPLTREVAADIPESMPTPRALAWIALGLILLPLSSHVLVTGAVGLATLLGISEAVIGLTIVAFGTSLPELAAAVISAVKREDDLAIGNIIGSNLFNLLGVLGLAALIHPMAVEPILLHRDVSVMFAVTALLVLLAWRPRRPGRINRASGGLLFGVFVVYIAAVIWQSLQ